MRLDCFWVGSLARGFKPPKVKLCAEGSTATKARPLQKAAARNETGMVSALLKVRADPSTVDTADGRQAIHHAVKHLNDFMVHLLLESKTPLDVADQTPNQAGQTSGFQGVLVQQTVALHKSPQNCGLQSKDFPRRQPHEPPTNLACIYFDVEAYPSCERLRQKGPVAKHQTRGGAGPKNGRTICVRSSG